MASLISFVILLMIWLGSSLLALIPLLFLDPWHTGRAILCFTLAPVLFCVSFPLIAGTLSWPFQKGIVPGKFPRDSTDPMYFRRRMFGLCWTQVYYFKPVYAVVLAIPALKRVVFRLFGYKGSLNFTAYPDTWIRDLPLLRIAEGAYLANRATIGSNLVLTDGSILVDSVTIGKGSMVGHLCIIGTGAILGDGIEIGMRSSIGIKVRIEDGANIKPHCAINHGTVIGKNAEVGIMSLVGVKCVIGDGVKLHAGSNIPNGTVLLTQRDAEQYFSSETSSLRKHREILLNLISETQDNA
jgi:carbonic anhydrase/acetyltransferase-like protein (isoleucine patch superfamily)